MHTFFIIKFFLRSGVLHTHEQSVVYRYSTQARKFICKYLSLIISPSAVSGFMKWDRNYNFRFPQPEIPFIRLQRTLCVKTGIFTPVIIFKRIQSEQYSCASSSSFLPHLRHAGCFIRVILPEHPGHIFGLFICPGVKRISSHTGHLLGYITLYSLDSIPSFIISPPP